MSDLKLVNLEYKVNIMKNSFFKKINKLINIFLSRKSGRQSKVNGENWDITMNKYEV